MPIPEATPELLQSIAEHDYNAVAAVADVTDEWEAARVVADGRAPEHLEFNHVALARAGEDTVDKLLRKAQTFFEKRKRAAAFALDPGATPRDLPQRLADTGYRQVGAPRDLMLWNPEAPHLFTEPKVYMTLATNATLDTWLDIATEGMDPAQAAPEREMLSLAYRTAGFTFLFGLYDGVMAGVCPMYVRNDIGRIGPVQVAQEYRRKGVALALANYATRQSRKDGAELTYLYNDHGGPATGLCRTMGYRTVAENARPFWVRR